MAPLDESIKKLVVELMEFYTLSDLGCFYDEIEQNRWNSSEAWRHLYEDTMDRYRVDRRDPDIWDFVIRYGDTHGRIG